MILSKKFRFIFIKGRKVAGTSVEMALSTVCGPDDIVTPITPIDEIARVKMGGRAQNYSDSISLEHCYINELLATELKDLNSLAIPRRKYYNHMPLSKVIEKYPDDLLRYKIVCVERSPYAKVLSLANMQLSYKGYKTGGEMRSTLEGVIGRLDEVLNTEKIQLVRNIGLYRWPDGRFDAHVLRYAHLTEDLQEFLDKLGTTSKCDLPHAKKGLMSDSFDMGNVYRRDQLDKINTMFREEFETFGHQII